jgi:translation initiation factor 1 (eIF-1/SUI1)
MGNKTITKVRGLEIFGFDISVVTKEFQKKYACSCTISAVKGFPKEKEIVMQGHLSFEVESYLIDFLTIPRHLMAIKVLKGVKPKKK